MEDGSTASFVVLCTPVVVVWVTCVVKVLLFQLVWFWAISSVAVWDCLSADLGVVDVGWGDVTAAESCFGRILSAEELLAGSLPRNLRNTCICDVVRH